MRRLQRGAVLDHGASVAGGAPLSPQRDRTQLAGGCPEGQALRFINLELLLLPCSPEPGAASLAAPSKGTAGPGHSPVPPGPFLWSIRCSGACMRQHRCFALLVPWVLLACSGCATTPTAPCPPRRPAWSHNDDQPTRRKKTADAKRWDRQCTLVGVISSANSAR